jgi:hypothetical protein
MTTYDLAEVREFAAHLDARINQCDAGEGMDCANLDGTLQHFAKLCVEYCDNVRKWARAIFTGQAASDPQVEDLWYDEGVRLYKRASEAWEYGQGRRDECFVLEGGAPLGSALWRLERLLSGWVTPKLAVGPAARIGAPMSEADASEAAARLNALPPLPDDWQPVDPRQQARMKKFPKRRPF